MTLGQRIQQIRTRAALSQEQFGDLLGTSRQTVSKWELDHAIPEIEKIVRMSRLFLVTTDSILVDGISTFETEDSQFVCGVYRSGRCEIVETERFALVYYCNSEQSVLGAKVYVGLREKKVLKAICERDQTAQKTEYAFETDTHMTRSNSSDCEKQLGEPYDASVTRRMKRTEKFFVDSYHTPLPTVDEVGIKNCLIAWRKCSAFSQTHDRFHLSLCTGKTEYVFSIQPQDDNIYCGVSYHVPFDMGLYDGGQFFRIRNYKDNSAPFCRFTCDFNYTQPQSSVPVEECQFGQCVQTTHGLLWCVKRYTHDEIVLQGCGDDEYIYRRADQRTEQFL